MNNFIENASRFDVSTGFHYDAAIFIVNMLIEQNKVKE